MSFHWSMTNFIGNSEIYPSNIDEMGFAIFALLLGFVASVCIVSRLSALMSQFHIITAEEKRSFAKLSRFLRINHISRDTTVNLHRSARYKLLEQRVHMKESDVKLLGLVSPQLIVQLHFEMYSHWLRRHIFLKSFCSSYPDAFAHICDTAISQHYRMDD